MASEAIIGTTAWIKDRTRKAPSNGIWVYTSGQELRELPCESESNLELGCTPDYVLELYIEVRKAREHDRKIVVYVCPGFQGFQGSREEIFVHDDGHQLSDNDSEAIMKLLED